MKQATRSLADGKRRAEDKAARDRDEYQSREKMGYDCSRGEQHAAGERGGGEGGKGRKGRG